MKISFFPAFLLSMFTDRIFSAPDNCEDKQLYLPFKVPDDQTCLKYYLCTSKTGNPAEIQCPDGLLYNDNTKSCTWPSLVNCNEQEKCQRANEHLPISTDKTCKTYLTCDDNLETGTATPCTESKIFSKVERRCVPNDQGYCDSIKGPNCRDEVYKTEKYLAVLNDCSAYYQCKGGVRIKGKCPNGMHIDTDSQKCVYASSSKCKDSSVSLPSVRDICKGKASQFVADPLYCKGYYYCMDESTPYWRLCGEKKYFNSGYCSQTKPSTCSCEDLDLKPNEEVIKEHPDKSKYYSCQKDKAPAVMTCPSGYIFSAAVKSCVPK